MKKNTVPNRTAVAFRFGNKFCFPDDETQYEFWGIEYKADVPCITYVGTDDKTHRRNGFHLLDLIKV